MSVNLTIDLKKGAVGALFEQLRGLPEVATRAALRGIGVASLRILGKIRKERMIGNGPFPVSQKKLGRVTHDMQRLLYATKPEVTDKGTVTVRFGSAVPYWAGHEFGFHGRVKVAGHVRRLGTSREAVADLVTRREGYSSAFTRVAPHSRDVRIPKRMPIQAALQDHAEDIYGREIERALDAALAKGGTA